MSFTKTLKMSIWFSAGMPEGMSKMGTLPSSEALLRSMLPRLVPSSSSKSSTSTVASLCPSPSSLHTGQVRQLTPAVSHRLSDHVGQLNSTISSSSSMCTAPTTSFRSDDDILGLLYTQVVGNTAKLTNLLIENGIENSKAILPSSVSPILWLAAMQTKSQAEASSSPSPTLPLLTTEVPEFSMSPASRNRNTNSDTSSCTVKDKRKSSLIDYSRYVKRYGKMRLLRFSSSSECGSDLCKDVHNREHFHCLDCSSKVFVRKEEIIRHFKWHKKRDESLQHGFLRHSPLDDCSDKFPNCAYNRKQTHYHCIMDGCDKCYISTSDVQMHANSHRKDSAIIQEGFQRYKGTEDCGLSVCAFIGLRTTHFHCRRPGCNFTFKNKADIEKHKSYHTKDEQLNRDGFKKFMKQEDCGFENCRLSRIGNHIHCIRPGCTYVLHSIGQLYSHKRKHQRSDNEQALQLAHNLMAGTGKNKELSSGSQMKQGDTFPQPISSVGSGDSSGFVVSGESPVSPGVNIEHNNNNNKTFNQSYLTNSAPRQADENLQPNDPRVIVSQTEPTSLLKLSENIQNVHSDDCWKKYLSKFTAKNPCNFKCDHVHKYHYHCIAENSNCSMVFRSKDDVRQHARNHALEDQVTDAYYMTIDGGGLSGCCPPHCPHQNKQRHYHCKWQHCREIILCTDKTFSRLDHYRMHKISHKLNITEEFVPLNMTTFSSSDEIFRRKRGRPEKDGTDEVNSKRTREDSGKTPD